MKKILIVVISIIFSISVNVYASEYQDRFSEVKYINDYIIKSKNGVKKYQQMTLMERVSDGHFVYCIEPGIAINSNNILTGSDINQSLVANITEEVWKRISLLAYYGYGYISHTDIKWYTITQFMIWKTVNNGYDIYFTDTLNGNRIDKYTTEIKEMEELISKHDIIPSFSNSYLNINVGSNISITDDNNVLNLYEVSSDDLVSVQKNGNSLVITGNKAGNTNISLTKKDKTLTHPPIVYVHPVSQDVVVRGSYKEVNANINIKIKNIAKVKVNKRDLETKEIVKISGIRFKIKDLNTNEYVCFNDECTFMTNDEGYFITENYLEEGKYRLEEINQKISGYLWNDKTIDFEISQNSNLIQTEEGQAFEIDFYNKPVKTKVNILKYGEKVILEDGNFRYDKILLDNVKFDLYAGNDIERNGEVLYKKDEFIKSVSSVNGKIILTDLELGKYYIIEKETDKNHIIDKSRHYFELEYIDQMTEIINVNIEINNYLKKGKLIFHKIDSETLEGLDNTKIEIYTKNDELIFSSYTDINGDIIVNDLFFGEFYIVERKAKDGYQLNDKKQEFEINDNNKEITVTMNNDKIIDKKVVISVPKTSSKDYLNSAQLILFLIGINGIITRVIYDKKNNL